MSAMTMKKAISPMNRRLLLVIAAATQLLWGAAHAAAPGITTTAGTSGTFNLTAQPAYLNQPDGQMVYSWGYGCVTGSAPTFRPTKLTAGIACSTMQVPGPTLIVTAGSTVTINLTNNLPT